MTYSKKKLFLIIVLILSTIIACFASGSTEVPVTLIDSVNHTYLKDVIFEFNGKTKPELEGYSFRYWASSPEGVALTVDEIKKGDFSSLYAIMDVNKYSVTVRDFGKSILGKYIVSYGDTLSSILNEPGLQREHYYIDFFWTDDHEIIHDDYVITSDLDLKASWAKEKLKVTIVDETNTTISIINVYYEDSLASTSYIPLKEGYALDHYELSDGSIFDENTAITENCSITAIFRKLFQISFYNGDSLIDVVSVPEGQNLSLPSKTTKKLFCIFVGWKDEKSGEFLTTASIINEDRKLTAVWKLNYGLVICTILLFIIFVASSCILLKKYKIYQINKKERNRQEKEELDRIDNERRIERINDLKKTLPTQITLQLEKWDTIKKEVEDIGIALSKYEELQNKVRNREAGNYLKLARAAYDGLKTDTSYYEIQDDFSSIDKDFNQGKLEDVDIQLSSIIESLTQFESAISECKLQLSAAQLIIDKEEDEKQRFQKENEENKRLLFEKPLIWITQQIIIDEQWNSSLLLLSSNGRSFSIEVYSPRINNLPPKRINYLLDDNCMRLFDRKEVNALLEYKERVRTQGKQNLVRALSSLPAPPELKTRLLAIDNINWIIKYIASNRDGEKTIERNPESLTPSDFNNDNKAYIDTKVGEESLEYYIKQLNSLIGLESVKKEVLRLKGLIQYNNDRRKEGLKPVPVSLHLVFSGNPGTGKTTVARILAGIYHKLGVLKKGQLIEVDRSKLVGGYVGQTALITSDQIDSALGGVLFIDEAYSLYSDNASDFGREAIDTILKAMEDKRDEFIVIMAGYTEPMRKLISMNPGLESRFGEFIDFPDYTVDELKEIFQIICKDYQLTLDVATMEYVSKKIDSLYLNRGENFSNARAIRKMFEAAIKRHAEINGKDTKTLQIEDFCR